MAFPYDLDVTFDDGTRGDFDGETDTVNQLDFPRYKELAPIALNDMIPFNGAYSMRLSLTGGTADAFLNETLAIAVGATEWFRLRMYVSPDFAATVQDIFNIFEVLATATVEGSFGLRANTDGTVEFGVGEVAPTVFSPILTLGAWYTIDVQVTVDLSVDRITNGTFAADTDWTKGTGWTIAAGVATAAAGSASSLEQVITIAAGENYTLTYDLTRTAGTITPIVGGTSLTTRATGGTFVEQVVAGAGVDMDFSKDDTFAGTVDNVTLISNDGVTNVFITKDGDPRSVAADLTIATLDQAAITQIRLGVQDHLGTTTGVILINDFIADLDDRIDVTERFPTTIDLTQDRHLFVGPGAVDYVRLMTSTAGHIVSLYDTDEAIATSGTLVGEAAIDISGVLDTVMQFQKGCYAVLTGTNPRANIHLVDDVHKHAGFGPRYYSPSGVKKLGRIA